MIHQLQLQRIHAALKAFWLPESFSHLPSAASNSPTQQFSVANKNLDKLDIFLNRNYQYKFPCLKLLNIDEHSQYVNFEVKCFKWRACDYVDENVHHVSGFADKIWWEYASCFW